MFQSFPDIIITVYSATEGMRVRPAYSVMTHLSIYIFLPMRSNFLAIILGITASTVYIIIFAFFTYTNDPLIGAMVSTKQLKILIFRAALIYVRNHYLLRTWQTSSWVLSSILLLTFTTFHGALFAIQMYNQQFIKQRTKSVNI